MDRLAEVLAATRTAANDEISAVCQQIGNRAGEILNERIASLEQQVQAAIEDARDSARRETTQRLNHSMRRLKQADSREVWVRTMLDTATQFCGAAALFAVNAATLRFEGSCGHDAEPGLEMPLSSSPAFDEAVRSLDTVVAAGTPGELSQTILDLLGERSPSRVYLLPVVLRQKAFAVLCAESTGDGRIDVSALELLCSLAAASIEATETTTESKPEELIRIAGAVGLQALKPVLPELTRSEQEFHFRAQRFARTRMAELVLRRMAAIRQGRASKNLYATLKDEIDAGRQAFRRQFIETCPSMVDYYHLELVKTLAKDDSTLLGPGYPGPLP